MKTLYTTILALAIILTTQAQSTKPAAFASYASEIPCNTTSLDQLMAQPSGTTVQVAIANGLTLIGNVIANVQKYDNLKTVIVELTNFPGVQLSVSKLSDVYTPEKYVGRMLGNAYNDAYEIITTSNGYKLVKVEQQHVIQPCIQK